MSLHVRRIEATYDTLHVTVALGLGKGKWDNPRPYLRWECSLRLGTPEWVKRWDERRTHSLAQYLRDLIEADGEGTPSEHLVNASKVEG